MEGATASSGAPLASRGSRLGAALIDGLIAAVPYLFIAMGQDNGFLLAIGLIGFLALIVIQLRFLIVDGQTIGKKILRIKIVMVATGQNGGFVPNVVLRGIVNGLLGFVPFYSLVDVLFIFREDRRCIHDLIAKTRVVQA
jgi:uncharacterized RDD family membrane protein YckC